MPFLKNSEGCCWKSWEQLVSLEHSTRTGIPLVPTRVTRCSTISQLMCCILFLVVFTVWKNALIMQLSATIFHLCFWHTGIAIHGLHSLMHLHSFDSTLHPETEWQHADVACTDMEHDVPHFIDCLMSLCWAVALAFIMQLIEALSYTSNGIM